MRSHVPPRTLCSFAAILVLFLAGCGPKAEQPSFQTLRLSNRTEREVAFAITLNGTAIPDIALKPQEGVLFHSTTPTLDQTKATMRGAHGEKTGFRGTNIHLQAVRNGAGGISPQGIFSGFRYFNREAARASESSDWRKIEVPEIKIIDVQILAEK